MRPPFRYKSTICVRVNYVRSVRPNDGKIWAAGIDINRYSLDSGRPLDEIAQALGHRNFRAMLESAKMPCPYRTAQLNSDAVARILGHDSFESLKADPKAWRTPPAVSDQAHRLGEATAQQRIPCACFKGQALPRSLPQGKLVRFKQAVLRTEEAMKMRRTDGPEIIALVGPKGSGKSTVGMAVALEFERQRQAQGSRSKALVVNRDHPGCMSTSGMDGHPYSVEVEAQHGRPWRMFSGPRAALLVIDRRGYEGPPDAYNTPASISWNIAANVGLYYREYTFVLVFDSMSELDVYLSDKVSNNGRRMIESALVVSLEDPYKPVTRVFAGASTNVVVTA